MADEFEPPEKDQPIGAHGTGNHGIGEQLAEWGKVALLETRGRVSGRATRSAVGFVEGDDGALLVAAGTNEADWARNLAAEPDCRVTIGAQAVEYRAELLQDPAERAATLTALILKYGTPAERLGRGPVFRLRRRSG